MRQTDSTAPTKNLGTLGTVGTHDGSLINDGLISTEPGEPTVPTNPTKKVERATHLNPK